MIVFVNAQSFAGSAQWDAMPASGDWNTANNWTPATVPNGSSDTATFDVSNTTSVSLSSNTEVNGITFNSGASPYTITANPGVTFIISGSGVTNNSGVTQNFITAVDTSTGNFGRIEFTNSAAAGNLATFTNAPTPGHTTGGETDFFGNSTAGSAIFINQGGSVSNGEGGATVFSNSASAGSGNFTTYGGTVSGASGGVTSFGNTATAANGTFTTNGGTANFAFGGQTNFFSTTTAGSGTFVTNGGTVSGAFGGETNLLNSSTAGSGFFTTNGGSANGALGGETSISNSSTAANAFFISNGGSVSGARGGTTSFSGTATASSATVVANGGTSGGDGGIIQFSNNSTGGTARLEIFGNGKLDISFHNSPGVSVGSIQGDGNIFLGANNLTVGTNNIFTTFSGVIQDGGGNGGTGGSLTKIGSGILTLSGANTYTGGTTVSSGTLSVTNSTGSGTGTGAVQLTAGTLGGTGTIAGAVTVGTGSGTGAFISPGLSPGTLTIQSALILNSDATYKFELSSSTAVADKIVANGVTINGAQFSFIDLGTSQLAVGTTFLIIDNTSSTAISGVFANLADNSTFTNNGNMYQVSYEGGTGNDLTLMVVPEPSSSKVFCVGILLLLGALMRQTHEREV